MQEPIKVVLKTSWGSQSWSPSEMVFQKDPPEMYLGTVSHRMKNCTQMYNGSPTFESYLIKIKQTN